MKILLSFLLICWGVYLSAENNNYSHLYTSLPFEMQVIEKPVFPDYSISIADFGGVADGTTLNTDVFEKAMLHLSEKGGGTLNVPEGIWLTGPIEFRSNINMHLEAGALILFSADFDLYPLIETIIEGQYTKRCQSLISGKNLENIAITGKGAINGSGQAWRPLKKGKVPQYYWDKVVKSGGMLKNDNYWVPTQSSLRGEEIMHEHTSKRDLTDEDWNSIKDFLRPPMVSFTSCKNILLKDVLFENSPMWNIHPLMCENVFVEGIFVRNPSYSQNGDGLDIESCKNVIVVNTTLDVGDDAICIKSGKNEEGRFRARPTENVIVYNCRVFQGHGGFVVGSEMSGGVKNIYVSNCQFLGTDIGLRFKSCRGRGGVVENIYIDGIKMLNIVSDALIFDLYYAEKNPSEKKYEADITTPVFRNIHVKNITCQNAEKALFFNGLPEKNITNVNLENIYISSRFGAELSESENIKLKNITIIPEKGPALLLNNVKHVMIDRFSAPNTLNPIVKITGDNNHHIQLPDTLEKDKVLSKN